MIDNNNTDQLDLLQTDVRLIAFYLPQFHPIPENDDWWGKGFTEWRNVASAKPLFAEHYQPHLPSDLGFYDLRLPEAREAQAALAKAYGVHGFCYYYYWFNGRRILERPLNEVLESGKPDFPFCICWANENWSRLWDGGNNELLLSQDHTLGSDIEFIRDVIPILQDDRYIRINGMPLLVLYRSDLLKDPKATAAAWREECQKAGLPGIHLCIVQSFKRTDPREIGFDSAVEFPPHQYKVANVTDEIGDIEEGFHGRVYDYSTVAQHSLARPKESYPLFRTLFPGWDNTSRKRKHALIYHGANPSRYEYWLRGLVETARAEHPPESRLLFVNAWNEWAEGAHLEPDLKFGRGYLEATSRALEGRTNWVELIELLRSNISTGGTERAATVSYIDELETAFQAQADRLRYFEQESADSALHRELRMSSPFVQISLEGDFPGAEDPNLKGWVETINGHSASNGAAVHSDGTMYVSGWIVLPDIVPNIESTQRFILIRKQAPATVFAAQIKSNEKRDDVAKSMADVDPKYTAGAGFAQLFSLRGITPGIYQVGTAIRAGERVATRWLATKITVTD
jgi:Glycosyltransferase WbsX